MPHIHPVLVDHKGLEVLNLDPLGDAGKAINDNFLKLGVGIPHATYELQWNAAIPIDFLVVPESRFVAEIKVGILTAFDGVGAGVKIGTPLDDDLFFEAADSDFTDVGVEFSKAFSVDGPVTVRLTLLPGTGPTTGSALIVVITNPEP